MKEFYEELYDAQLEIEGPNYYAITDLSIHPQIGSSKQEVLTSLDIYFAELIFPILVDFASKKEFATYKQISDEIKLRHPDNKQAQNLQPIHVGRRLGAIWSFTKGQDCPHIGSLVVNGNTKECGPGFSSNIEPQHERERCYNYNWSGISDSFTNHINYEVANRKRFSKKLKPIKKQAAGEAFWDYYKSRQKDIEEMYARADIEVLKALFVDLVKSGHDPAAAFGNVTAKAIAKKELKPRNTEPAYVYAGEYFDRRTDSPIFDLIKIGYSANLEDRASTLAGNVKGPLGFRFISYWKFQPGCAYPIEQWLHGQLSDYRDRGEFFTATGSWLSDTVSELIDDEWAELLL